MGFVDHFDPCPRHNDHDGIERYLHMGYWTKNKIPMNKNIVSTTCIEIVLFVILILYHMAEPSDNDVLQ
jgi:hypothetical protein